MKNRIRINEHNDPSLGPGWGAFVEPTNYKKHLRKYVTEKDVRTGHESYQTASANLLTYRVDQYLHRIRSFVAEGNEKHRWVARLGCRGLRVCSP